MRRLLFLVLSGAALVTAPPSDAQELRGQPTPLTAWIDLRPAPPGATPQTTPAWVEALDFIPAKPEEARAPGVPNGNPEVAAGMDRSRSVFRIRLQHPGTSSNDLQVRVFFDDAAGCAPTFVSAWNELGVEKMRSDAIGTALGLPSSETLTVPMDGADYLEISVAGDGSHVRGVFLTWLEETHVLEPLDFPAGEPVRQPFGVLPSTQVQRNDNYLYGVVTANLQDTQPTVLTRGTAPSATFEFELEHQPLVAIISYEVLAATLDAAPTVTINERAQGACELHWPDLADPGFQGVQNEAAHQMNFRYTGWIHAQKVVPGNALRAGLNSLTLSLSEASDTLAIRALQIQLKYNWEKLDYKLAPAVAPDEKH